MKKIHLTLIFLFLIIMFANSASMLSLDIVSAQIMAIQNNSEIKISRMTRNLNQRSYIFGYSKYFPQFSTNFSFSNNVIYGIKENIARLYTDPYLINVTLNVDQMIFDGGESISSSIFKYYELGINGIELSEKEEKIKSDTENQYSEIVFTKDKIEEQKRSLEIMQKDSITYKKKADLGVITQIEYKEFLLQINEQELSLITSQKEYYFLLIAFKQLLNLDPDLELDLTTPIEIKNTEIKDDLYEVFLKKALYNTSKSNSTKLAYYKSQTKQAMTYLTLLPKLSMKFSYTFEGNNFPLNKKNWDLSFKVAWDLPLFPINANSSVKFPSDNKDSQKQIDQTNEMLGTFKTDADIKILDNLDGLNKFEQSSIETYKSKTEYEKFIMDLKINIKKNIWSFNEQVKTLNLNLDKVKLLEEKLKIQQVKFDVGESRFLDVIDSEVKLYQTKITVIETKTKIYKQIVELQNLTGFKKDELNGIIQ
jgi:outer membrane protein TolC